MNEYKNLWKAVLSQAVKDISSKNVRINRAAKYWFTRKNDNCGTFIWICLVLNYDANTLRKKLLKHENLIVN